MLTVTADPVLLDRFVAAGAVAGCPPDQVERFASAGYVAQPKQFSFHAAARACDLSGGPVEVHIGGTRASAKTHAIFAQVAIDDCQRLDGLKFLFLRNIKKAAAESFEDLASKILRLVPHEFSREAIRFSNGSRIVIGGFKDESDIDKYIGVEYDGIVAEEFSLVSGSKQDMIRGSLRTSRTDWRPRLYASWNPGGIGYADIKRRVVLPWRSGAETKTRFIYASHTDNAFINPEYREYLDGLQGYLRKVWRDGDLDVTGGLAFPAFNRDLHVIPAQEIQDNWPRWRAVDYGYSPDPFSCHWYARDLTSGRIHVYREAYDWMLTDEQQARKIKAMTLPGETIVATYAGADMFATKTVEGKVSTNAKAYASQGVVLTRADIDRIQGKRKIERLLAPLLDGKPGIVIHDCCPKMIDQLETLVTKEGKEDIADGQEDHAYDDLRYGLTNYESYSQTPEQQQTDPAVTEAYKKLNAFFAR